MVTNYSPVNLIVCATQFAAELKRAIESGQYSDADTLHLKRLLGNVNKLIKEIQA